jgi:hypothetical protein
VPDGKALPDASTSREHAAPCLARRSAARQSPR